MQDEGTPRKKHKPAEIVAKLRDVLLDGELLQPGRGEDRHRDLAPPQKHQTPSHIAGIRATSFRAPPVAGFAPRNRFAGHPDRGAKTHHSLRLRLDHSGRADPRRLEERRGPEPLPSGEEARAAHSYAECILEREAATQALAQPADGPYPACLPGNGNQRSSGPSWSR